MNNCVAIGKRKTVGVVMTRRGRVQQAAFASHIHREPAVVDAAFMLINKLA